MKRLRRLLNILMIVTTLGTIPYIFIGDSLYRHEVFGIAALCFVLYHCIINKWWYVKLLKTRTIRSEYHRLQLRNILSLSLTIITIILVISSVMVSDLVFKILQIRYSNF